MSRAKYLFTILIGTLVYVLLSLSFGQNSIYCYNQLEDQKKLISKQTTEIQNINTELQMELTALQNDKAVIAAYARKLDYVSPDEKLLKINGLPPAQNTLYDVGSVLHHTEVSFISEKICKIISLFVFILSLIIMVLFDISTGNISFNRNKTIVAGIPVYDLPQV